MGGGQGVGGESRGAGARVFQGVEAAGCTVAMSTQLRDANDVVTLALGGVSVGINNSD